MYYLCTRVALQMFTCRKGRRGSTCDVTAIRIPEKLRPSRDSDPQQAPMSHLSVVVGCPRRGAGHFTETPTNARHPRAIPTDEQSCEVGSGLLRLVLAPYPPPPLRCLGAVVGVLRRWDDRAMYVCTYVLRTFREKNEGAAGSNGLLCPPRSHRLPFLSIVSSWGFLLPRQRCTQRCRFHCLSEDIRDIKATRNLLKRG